ncbi:hypothetical protein LPJ66_005040 [Kickxella alabastrina]|uniref:Uncharacterized protein n=1 Tax=Kickxella alabastrina TaxID=61397 RepID=A0ACC1IJL1_9FUNG|nr:hypothetical protein LPJ66_005040 [Kickxella alabastrina]
MACHSEMEKHHRVPDLRKVGKANCKPKPKNMDSDTATDALQTKCLQTWHANGMPIDRDSNEERLSSFTAKQRIDELKNVDAYYAAATPSKSIKDPI